MQVVRDFPVRSLFKGFVHERSRHGKLVCLLCLCLLALSGCDLIPGSSSPGTQLTPVPTATEAAADATPSGMPAIPACVAANLTGVAGWQGATGGLAGGIFIANNGDEDCVLQGRPGVHIIGADGAMLPITDVHPADSGSSCCPPPSSSRRGGSTCVSTGETGAARQRGRSRSLWRFPAMVGS